MSFTSVCDCRRRSAALVKFHAAETRSTPNLDACVGIRTTPSRLAPRTKTRRLGTRRGRCLLHRRHHRRRSRHHSTRRRRRQKNVLICFRIRNLEGDDDRGVLEAVARRFCYRRVLECRGDRACSAEKTALKTVVVGPWRSDRTEQTHASSTSVLRAADSAGVAAGGHFELGESSDRRFEALHALAPLTRTPTFVVVPSSKGVKASVLHRAYRRRRGAVQQFDQLLELYLASYTVLSNSKIIMCRSIA